jgi:hypothetical protein
MSDVEITDLTETNGSRVCQLYSNRSSQRRQYFGLMRSANKTLIFNSMILSACFYFQTRPVIFRHEIKI